MTILNPGAGAVMPDAEATPNRPAGTQTRRRGTFYTETTAGTPNAEFYGGGPLNGQARLVPSQRAERVVRVQQTDHLTVAYVRTPALSCRGLAVFRPHQEAAHHDAI